MAESWSSYVRIKVRFNVTKPLKSTMFVTMLDGSCRTFNVAYEHLPKFCHFCGILGYEMEICSKLVQARYQTKEEFFPELKHSMNEALKPKFGTSLKPPLIHHTTGRNRTTKLIQLTIADWSKLPCRSAFRPSFQKAKVALGKSWTGLKMIETR